MLPQEENLGPGTSSHSEGLFDNYLSGDGKPEIFQSDSKSPCEKAIPQVPVAFINGQRWHRRTRSEPAYLARRPRRLPNPHGAVGDGRRLPQNSAPAASSTSRDPEGYQTHNKLKASPHSADLFPSDEELLATTLAELVASSIPDEEHASEASALAITPSTSYGDPDPDSQEPAQLSQETGLLYFRDWKSTLSHKHGSPRRP